MITFCRALRAVYSDTIITNIKRPHKVRRTNKVQIVTLVIHSQRITLSLRAWNAALQTTHTSGIELLVFPGRKETNGETQE
ncbi:hypothetical protein HETIRDRAFT_419839 [Heterobasidion irregulare TC 32-1]|uniref:Uncharacterized protein n=1 Tax=Heterobasidion irregulare (strain TC 32-1) TaxID=747525 RepID=W4JZQ8_HETIT|nr:uncharacterized protein HETIRDRAFT_419839 [Heterobasidion irregulare TC 32-1]ETW78575.1 hypothetical protein HETIRDRAFT_419839 [Heterobasidion irregulare TC 32-1]